MCLLDFSVIAIKCAAHHTPPPKKIKAQIIKERKNIMQIKYTLNMAGLETNQLNVAVCRKQSL